MVIIGRGRDDRPPPGQSSSPQAPGVQCGGDGGAHRASTPPTWRRSCGRPTSWWRPPAGPHLLTPDMVKPGAAVVSAGTSFEGKKLIPDAHPDVAEVAGWITPRLGGVGPMTRAMLLRNALRAAESRPGERARPQAGSRARRETTTVREARPMSEREYSERPWGNYTVLERRRARPQGQAHRGAPGQTAQLSAPLPAGRALVHRGGHGHRDARRHRQPGARRARRSTSPWRASHRIANEGDDRRRLHRGAAGDVLRRGRHRPARGRLRARGRRRIRCSRWGGDRKKGVR